MRRSLLAIAGLLTIAAVGCGGQTSPTAPIPVPAEFTLSKGSIIFEPGPNYPIQNGPSVPAGLSTGIWIAQPSYGFGSSVPYPGGGQLWPVCVCGPNGEWSTPTYKPIKTNVDYLIYASDRPRNTTLPHKGDPGDQFYILGQRVTRRIEAADFNYNRYRMMAVFRVIDGKGTIQ